MIALLVLLAAAALGAAGVAAVLPSPHHRWALGAAALAAVTLLWPVACSSASDGASTVASCSSGVGVRLPGGVGAVAAIAVAAGVCVVVVLVRRRRPPG